MESTAKKKGGIAYQVGAQWGRMSWPSRAGAVVTVAVIVGLFIAVTPSANRAAEQRNAIAPLAPSKTERSPDQIRADREINLVLAGARWLKDSMKKPETFELLRATMIDGKVICYEYRARNSWNDRSPGTYVISDDVSSDKPKEWNKLCAGKSGTDYTSVRAVM